LRGNKNLEILADGVRSFLCLQPRDGRVARCALLPVDVGFDQARGVFRKFNKKLAASGTV
jgi:hypothetical protein